jgi:hypothetical protein
MHPLRECCGEVQGVRIGLLLLGRKFGPDVASDQLETCSESARGSPLVCVVYGFAAFALIAPLPGIVYGMPRPVAGSSLNL